MNKSVELILLAIEMNDNAVIKRCGNGVPDAVPKLFTSFVNCHKK